MINATIGMRLQLAARSKKGKQRIQEFDTIWKLLATADTVLFSQRAGPWLYIEPMAENASSRLRGGRWIHAHQDDDFQIIKEV